MCVDFLQDKSDLSQFPLMHSFKYIMLGAEMLIIYNLLE